jgi:hypothetical protein
MWCVRRRRLLRYSEAEKRAKFEWQMPDTCEFDGTLQLRRRSETVAILADSKSAFLSHGRPASAHPACGTYQWARNSLIVSSHCPVLARRALYAVQVEAIVISRRIATEFFCCRQPSAPRFILTLEERDLSWPMSTRGTIVEAAAEIGTGCAFQVHYVAPHHLAVLVGNCTDVYHVPFEKKNASVATRHTASARFRDALVWRNTLIVCRANVASLCVYAQGLLAPPTTVVPLLTILKMYIWGTDLIFIAYTPFITGGFRAGPLTRAWTVASVQQLCDPAAWFEMSPEETSLVTMESRAIYDRDQARGDGSAMRHYYAVDAQYSETRTRHIYAASSHALLLPLCTLVDTYLRPNPDVEKDS